MLTNSNGQVFISTNTNAWRSDDEGDTWSAIPTPAPQHTLRSLQLSPDEEALCKHDQQADTPQR
ncbi:MAG: hypothetical protein R2810_04920 [Flavobacteriales bacterium]